MQTLVRKDRTPFLVQNSGQQKPQDESNFPSKYKQLKQQCRGGDRLP